jgi:hypothetical protein
VTDAFSSQTVAKHVCKERIRSEATQATSKLLIYIQIAFKSSQYQEIRNPYIDDEADEDDDEDEYEDEVENELENELENENGGHQGALHFLSDSSVT